MTDSRIPHRHDKILEEFEKLFCEPSCEDDRKEHCLSCAAWRLSELVKWQAEVIDRQRQALEAILPPTDLIVPVSTRKHVAKSLRVPQFPLKDAQP